MRHAMSAIGTQLARRRVLALLLASVQVLGTIGPAAATTHPLPSSRPSITEAPTDADVCALLTEDEVLRASGATTVLVTPGPQNVLPNGCRWDLDADDPASSTRSFTLALQSGGGRERFDEEARAMGGRPASGLGDAAIVGISGDVLVRKGDTVVITQYIAFGGGGRPGSVVLRALTWRALGRLTADGDVPGDPDATVRRLTAASFTDDTVTAAIEGLARSGVGTYAGPADLEPLLAPVGEASPMVLLEDQVRAMALEAWAGGGLLGADLDALMEVDEDLVPPSFLLAGYVAAVETDGARLARSLMGDQDWAEAPSIVFPQLVLTLFVADIARERSAQADGQTAVAGTRAAVGRRDRAPAVGRAGAAGTTASTGLAQVVAGPRTAQASICGDVAGFVDRALVRVFEALRLDVPSDPVGSVLVTIWNFAVSVTGAAVRAIVGEFQERVVGLIAQAAATAAFVTTIVSVLRPWTLVATVDPSVTEKGYPGRAPDRGVIRVRVELGGLQRWPAFLESCARDLGIALPKISPEGDRIGLAVRQSPADLMAMDPGVFTLDADGRRDLAFTTLIDDGDGPWEVRTGVFQADVSVQRAGLGDLARLGVDGILRQLPERVRPIVWSLIQGPFTRLRTELDGLIRRQTTSTGLVRYHIERATPEPGVTEAPPQAVWVHFDRPGLGDGVTSVAPLRILEFVACRGVDGPWEGVLRTGALTANAGFEVPVAEFPVGFQVPPGGSTSFVTSGVVDMPAPLGDVPITYSARVTIRGDRMSVTGLPVAAFAAAAMASLRIEPAPAGMCPR